MGRLRGRGAGRAPGGASGCRHLDTPRDQTLVLARRRPRSRARHRLGRRRPPAALRARSARPGRVGAVGTVARARLGPGRERSDRRRRRGRRARRGARLVPASPRLRARRCRSRGVLVGRGAAPARRARRGGGVGRRRSALPAAPGQGRHGTVGRAGRARRDGGGVRRGIPRPPCPASARRPRAQRRGGRRRDDPRGGRPRSRSLPLATDDAHAQRVADLQLYVRQHHADRAVAEIGAQIQQGGGAW